MKTSGLWALVTGASSGIGWQISEQLAAKGCNIIGVSNQSTLLENLKQHLEQSHAIQVLTLCQDLAREAAAQDIYDYCLAQKLEVDILVNNAGMLLFGEMVDSEYDVMKSILHLHVNTPALLCRLFGAQMKEKRSGYILNVSSISAVMPFPTISVYGPTKTFLRYFTRAIRTELKPYGVRVCCLIPGTTDTPLNDPFGANLGFWRKIGIVRGPAFVARAGIRAMFRNRARCIPGIFNKAIILLVPTGASIRHYFLQTSKGSGKHRTQINSIMEQCFQEKKLGNSELILKSLFIRSAAYEGMQKDGLPTEALTEHHVSMIKGGVGLTTVSYGAVSPEARTFHEQMYIKPQSLEKLSLLATAVHEAGGKVSMQLTHCGYFTKNKETRRPGCTQPGTQCLWDLIGNHLFQGNGRKRDGHSGFRFCQCCLGDKKGRL